MHQKWSPQRAFEPTTSQSWVFFLAARPQHLGSQIVHFFNLLNCLMFIQTSRLMYETVKCLIKILLSWEFLCHFDVKEFNALAITHNKELNTSQNWNTFPLFHNYYKFAKTCQCRSGLYFLKVVKTLFCKLCMRSVFNH